MTRTSKRRPGRQPASPKQTSRWPLQDAKARFSELVRRAKVDGPQHVTVHGREEVVVISAVEFSKLKGELTGAVLVELMRQSPLRDVDFGSEGDRMPVRDVAL